MTDPNKQMQPVEGITIVRHTIISEDEHDLLEAQAEDWQYFIEGTVDV